MSTTTGLPHDVCRCHDSTCPQAMQCARYVWRTECGERTPHAATMRETGQACGHLVQLYIKGDDLREAK